MRFLYVTDLHGWVDGYMEILQAGLSCEVEAIVNGGDMLPKGNCSPTEQQLFIEEFLGPYIESVGAYGIEYYGMFGNDDLRSVWDCWKELMGAYDNAHDLTEAWKEIGEDVNIRGCSYVPDHPFGLKDWSVLDTRSFTRPQQLTVPVLSKGKGFVQIDDIDGFFDQRPTLEELLAQVAEEAPSLERAILVCHAPPVGMGLANVDDKRDVGSVAVRQWIEKHQPLLTLHGHIHESPLITGVDTVELGRTTVHQPGQDGFGSVIFSIISINEDGVSVERKSVASRSG